MASQFDALADMYEESFLLPWRSEMEAFSIFALLGDLRDNQVLDMGCGSGVYSRELARRGARRVVGYDPSAGMIEHAQRRESGQPQGISYTSQPPGDSHAFDLALGVYVLPYAENYADLVALCLVAAHALRPNGRFVTLPINPRYSTETGYYEPYHIQLTSHGPTSDATPVELRVRFNAYDAKVTAHYWSRTTLEDALSEAGFTDIQWHGHQVSPRGLAEHGGRYWNPYLEHPHAALVEARLAQPGAGRSAQGQTPGTGSRRLPASGRRGCGTQTQATGPVDEGS